MNPASPDDPVTPQAAAPHDAPPRASRRRWWRQRVTLILSLLAAGVLIAATVRLVIGDTPGWPQGSILNSLHRMTIAPWTGEFRTLSLLDIRLTRVVIASVAGIALSIAGVALQSLLRNPLAEPYILGLSTGAAAGVIGQMLLSEYIGRAIGGQHVGAALGAMLSMAVVYAAGRRHGVLDPLGLLLVGVVLSTINGAIIMTMNYILGPAGLMANVARWMMGYLNEGVDLRTLQLIGVFTVFAGLWLLRQARAMDASAFTDAEAMALGVNLTGLRRTQFVLASLLAAGAVVLAGPIAFVGLICPHVARMLVGPGHAALVVASAFTGALLLLLADTAVFALDFGQGRLPLGIFTAILGGITFLWMLRPHLGRGM